MMLFLQDAPADTFNYMVFGFAVIFGSMGFFLLSLRMRFRNLKRDLVLLDTLEKEEND
jgi:hypothetical protein